MLAKRYRLTKHGSFNYVYRKGNAVKSGVVSLVFVRGGKGVKTINITEKTGKLISIQAVTDDNDLMIINRSGLTIRTSVEQIRLAGRATQGVRIINLREGDAIASVMAVPAAGEEEEMQNTDGAADATDSSATPSAE